MSAFGLLKTQYPCCNSASRFESPTVGQELKRSCAVCKRSFRVRIVRALISDRWGIDVLKAVWEAA